MGLAQRRIAQEFQNTEFAVWKKQFEEIVGFEIPMEIKWDTMQSDDRSNKDDYFKWYQMVYFTPLLDVFKGVCADDMGKEAVRSMVKKIVIDGTVGGSPSASTFEDGVFQINHKYCTNVGDGDDRTRVWTQLIESKL